MAWELKIPLEVGGGNCCRDLKAKAILEYIPLWGDESVAKDILN